MTKIDISITCASRKTIAPVTVTAATPSASGSAAAASEPNTASRMSSTSGRPTNSASSRSFLDSSCMPAHRPPWPTMCSGTAAPSSPMSRLTRIWDASSTLSSRLAVTTSGMSTTGSAAVAGGVQRLRRRAHALDVLEAFPSCTLSTAAASACGSPRRLSKTIASVSDCVPGMPASASDTALDSEPGTSKPPPVRAEVWRAASGAATIRSASQRPRTSRRRRETKRSSRSIVACMAHFYRIQER